MKLYTKAVNFEIAERLEKHIEKKTKRYEKLLPESAELVIRMTVVKPETNLNKETHVRVVGCGAELFAQKVCDNPVPDSELYRMIHIGDPSSPIVQGKAIIINVAYYRGT